MCALAISLLNRVLGRRHCHRCAHLQSAGRNDLPPTGRGYGGRALGGRTLGGCALGGCALGGRDHDGRVHDQS